MAPAPSRGQLLWLLTKDEQSRFGRRPRLPTIVLGNAKRTWRVRQLQEPFLFVRSRVDVDDMPRRTRSRRADRRPTNRPGRARLPRQRPRDRPSRHRLLRPPALDPGDILVAPITDPSWTPLFVPAAAVVVDVGAPLSHAIIVSRELGIPCVVSATDATRRIPDGATIEVDGDTGVVTVISLP